MTPLTSTINEQLVFERDLGRFSAEHKLIGPNLLLPVIPIVLAVAGFPLIWIVGVSAFFIAIALLRIRRGLREPQRVTIQDNGVLFEVPFGKRLVPFVCLRVSWYWVAGTFTSVNLKIRDTATGTTYLFPEEFNQFVELGKAIENRTQQ